MALILQKIITEQNVKNGSHLLENCHRAKFPITEPLRVWVSTFPRVDRNGKLALATMEKWLPILQKLNIEQNFQLLTPPKVWVPAFPRVNGNGIYGVSHYEKWKNGSHLAENICRAKSLITRNACKNTKPIYSAVKSENPVKKHL